MVHLIPDENMAIAVIPPIADANAIDNIAPEDVTIAVYKDRPAGDVILVDTDETDDDFVINMGRS